MMLLYIPPLIGNFAPTMRSSKQHCWTKTLINFGPLQWKRLCWKLLLHMFPVEAFLEDMRGGTLLGNRLNPVLLPLLVVDVGILQLHVVLPHSQAVGS